MNNQKVQAKKVVSPNDECYAFMLSLEELGPDAKGNLVIPKSKACATVPTCQKFLTDFESAGKKFNILGQWVFGSDFNSKVQDPNYSQMTTNFVRTECKKQYKSKRDAEQCMIQLKGLSSTSPEKRQESVEKYLLDFNALHDRAKECFVALGKPIPK